MLLKHLIVNHEKLYLKVGPLFFNLLFLIIVLIFSLFNQGYLGVLVLTPDHESEIAGMEHLLDSVSSSVRQGGILSPFLFNMYRNDLPLLLNARGTGCWAGDTLINHLMYADDLVIFSPYSAGVQQLLKVCSQYGHDFDIKFSAKRSKIMMVTYYILGPYPLR